jgi:hypothetical protein
VEEVKPIVEIITRPHSGVMAKIIPRIRSWFLTEKNVLVGFSNPIYYFVIMTGPFSLNSITVFLP